MGASCGMLSHRDSTTRSRSVTGKAVSSARAWSMLIMKTFYRNGLTAKLSSSQPTTSRYRRTLSRVCSNAWFCPLRRPPSMEQLARCDRAYIIRVDSD